MKVLVTGACGYKGSVLTPKLLERGHDVRAVDIMWFGNELRPHPNLEVVKADVRDAQIGGNGVPLAGVDSTWKSAFMTSRTSTERGRPPRLAGQMNGLTSSHSASVQKSMRKMRWAIGSTTIDPKLRTSAEQRQYEGYLRQ